MTDNLTYEVNQFSSVTKVTVKSISNLIKELDWLNYEVAPEWKRFCSFGPEDIGTVWEQIGAIRKRKLPRGVVISEQIRDKMIKKVEKMTENKLFGIPVISSPFLKETEGFIFYE